MSVDRNAVIETLLRSKVLIIMRGYNRDQLMHIGEAVYAGGVCQMEVTFDQLSRTPHEETDRIITALREKFDGRMHVGAGTVMTLEQLHLACDAGAEFIVSPDSYQPVIEETRALGLVSMPGAFSPTEAANAYRWGADFVKLFPNAALGAGYLKDLAAPLSHIRFLAVGGVTLENIAQFAAAGAVGYGVASGIVKRAWVEAGDWAAITRQAKAYIDALARA